MSTSTMPCLSCYATAERRTWRHTRAYAEWLYYRDRYVIPGALFLACGALAEACTFGLGWACGWL